MTKSQKISRRRFLQTALTAGSIFALPGCDNEPLGSPIGGEIRGFNVHPYMGSPMNVQLQALRDIGANWIRTTLGISTDSAGGYVTATGTNVLGLISDFQMTSIDKTDWPDMVETVIRRYPSLRYVQILNEPEVFFDISNREYVLDYLKPASLLLLAQFPHIQIVSAAPIGQPSGINDFAMMSAAGADDYCDFRGVHIYFGDNLLQPWSSFRRTTQKPIMVTETGSRHPEEHLSWWLNQIPHMQYTLDTNYIFYYALLEQPELTGFEIISGELDPQGNVVPRTGSELYMYLQNG